MTADCDAIACLGEGAELLDAEFAQALAAMPKPPPPPADVDPEQLLLGLQPILAGVQKEAAALLGEPKGMKITERTVPASDGYAIPIRIYVPESNTSSNTYPLTVYLHEGAFCVGNLDTEEAPCRALCASPTPSVIVNVAYRLAPMYRWPTAEEDCWTVLKWLVGNVGTGADSALSSVDFEKGFVLGGASAGALVTCKLTQRAVVDSLTSSTFAHPVKITGQILHIPTTIAHSPRDPTNEEIDSLQGITDDEKATLKDMKSWADTRGYPDFAGLPVTRPMVAMFDAAYKAAPTPLAPEISPLLAPSSVFAQLPRAFITIAGLDPLKDEAIAYARRMQVNGVEVKVEIYPGVTHAFQEFAPDTKIARKWKEDLVRGLGWVLGQTEYAAL